MSIHVITGHCRPIHINTCHYRPLYANTYQYIIHEFSVFSGVYMLIHANTFCIRIHAPLDIQQSPSELQNSLLQAQTILSTLYREIEQCNLPYNANTRHLKTIILPTPTDNEDSSDSEDDDGDMSNNQ